MTKTETTTTTRAVLKWRSCEHNHTGDRGQDWFWALGLIAVSVAVASILLGNSLFGMLILLAAVVIGMSTNQKLKESDYVVTIRGITIDNKLYPYKSIVAFFIDESHPDRNILILDVQKPLVPHMIINLPESLDRDELQDFLLDYLPEAELHESPANRVAELLGF